MKKMVYQTVKVVLKTDYWIWFLNKLYWVIKEGVKGLHLWKDQTLIKKKKKKKV